MENIKLYLYHNKIVYNNINSDNLSVDYRLGTILLFYMYYFLKFHSHPTRWHYSYSHFTNEESRYRQFK